MSRLTQRSCAGVLAVLTLFAAASLSSCSSSKGGADSAYGYAETSSASMSPEVYSEKADYDFSTNSSAMTDYYDYSGSSSQVTDTRKIVRTMNLDLETKEFDAGTARITSLTSSYGGYVESSYVTGKSYESYYYNTRSASYTLRIPADSLDKFVAELCSDGEGFNVLSKNEDSNDITDTYYDAQSRLDSLETQEERLLAMLEGATELEYMLQIEDKLADVRYQIENYYSTLTRYDKSVELSTLSISLSEVIEYQEQVVAPKTFGERMLTAFTNSWSDFADGCKNFAVDFVYAVPTLLVLAVIIAAFVLIIRAIVRKNKRKKQPAAPYQPYKTDGGDKPSDSDKPSGDEKDDK